MSDAAAFFRAIEADPDDDTPRLVYADWLDEHAASDADRARAEFVRVQCELARDPDMTRRFVLAVRESALQAAHGRAWAGRWHAEFARHGYRRGFLDPVTLTGANFARHAESLSEFTPLCHVQLASAHPNEVRGAVACPLLARVRWLRLWRPGNAEMTALAASPHLGAVRSLDLSRGDVGFRGATDLAVARMPALRALDVSGAPITDRGLLALAQADWPSFESLDASRCGLRSPGVIGLAEGALVPRLTALVLTGNPDVATAAWVRLASAPFARLQHLQLSDPALTDGVAESLAENPSLTGLSALYFNSASVTDRTADALLGSPHLRRLRKLRLSEYSLGAAVRKRLRERFGAGFNPPADVWEDPR